MLDSQSAVFAERVWEVASQLGNNDPKIADDMMETAFPLTCTQARQEGALQMLRIGIIIGVKRTLRNRSDVLGQSDFSELSENFAPLVQDLRSKSYFVESAEEYVSISGLIAEPDLLDDARRFMRRKGKECLDEADRLDALYVAVTCNGADASAAAPEVLA
jgi:hypothetical protein